MIPLKFDRRTTTAKVVSQGEFLLWFSFFEPGCRFKFLSCAPVLRSWFGAMVHAPLSSNADPIQFASDFFNFGCTDAVNANLNWSVHLCTVAPVMSV